MGTQQILLIVLSVIIVGAAIAVGIDMFNRQDFSSNRSAAASDVQIFLTQVLQYYKMPESLGGLGGDIDNAEDADAIASYIGWGDENPMSNDNATYMVEIPEHTDDLEIVDIKAIGSAELNGKHSVVHGRITFPAGKIVSRVDEIAKTGDIVDTDFVFDLWTD
ncbi:MAG: hypothetical protein PHQ78_03255 [Candidatus Cloacimonetes bacterium]|jgi:hypothetical protein|nr:hypothetical protein [Candidatus Cloacimonadota bacterium]MDD2506316.1 hypothetical protein [Candidatus Cloacimonadota bacterium]MDD4560116.1 hypothetical protein [Candidatus Cloacimonadota bacterium]